MTAYLDFPSWISPTVLPGFPVRWYGIMYLLAFAVTFVLFRHELARKGLSSDRDQAADFFFWAVFGLLIGGRLFYVFVYDDAVTYLRRPWTIVWPFEDGRFTGIRGMSYHGGFIGATLAAIIYARVRKLDLLEWADTMAVSAPLGYTLGRLGNFINGELVGRVTTVEWGMLFPNARRYPAGEAWVMRVAEAAGIPLYDPAQMVNLPRHPSQLYEAFLEGVVLWLLLWFVFRKNRPFRGALMALYITGYGVARLMAGYFRETDESVGFVISPGSSAGNPALVSGALHLTEGQVFSLVMVALGAILLALFRLLHRPPPVVETFEDSSQTE